MIESYTLTLPKSGMDAIIAALNELPYKVARPLLDEALRQFIEQEKAAGVPQPGDAPAPEGAAGD